MTTNTINDGLNTETQKRKNAQPFEIQSRDICTLTPTKRPLSTIVCIEIQHDSESRTIVALMLNFKIQNPLTDISLHHKYWTPRTGPCFALLPLYDSLNDRHLFKTDPFF